MKQAHRKHVRLIKLLIEVIGEDTLTTREILDIILDGPFKRKPTMQRLTNLLHKNPEFIKIEEKQYIRDPTQWRLNI